MATFSLFFFTLTLLTISTTSHNITQILSETPDYSSFNNYLTQTKLADEINSRTTITLLVLNNGAMSSLASKHPLSVIKNVLSLLVLLDYYDPTKLHKISKGSTLSTTLYQTTGSAPGNLGFVNITDLKGGKIGFGSAAPGSKLDSSYTKSIKQIPYNISVLEINAPIIAPGVLTGSNTSALNITGLLEKAGCKTFAGLLVSTGVLKNYEAVIDKGLTVFAPNDEAFKDSDVPDLKNLTKADVVSLLEYHALGEYKPKGSLKTNHNNNISTLATNGARKFGLTTSTDGDEVVLHTGVAPSRVADTVVDETPVVIFTVDNVLLPVELFGKAVSPAPAPAPEVAPTPAPVEAPSPLAASPPAPPSDESPDGSPSDEPTGSAKSKAANAAVGLGSPLLFTVLVTVFGAVVAVSV